MLSQDQATSSSNLFSLVLILVLFLPLVFMMVNQRRRVRETQQLNAELQVGDEIVTTSGIFGRIVALDNVIATVEIAPGVQIRLDRWAVRMRAHAVGEGGPAAPGGPTGPEPTPGTPEER